jgi:hypothetical protein
MAEGAVEPPLGKHPSLQEPNQKSGINKRYLAHQLMIVAERQ